MDDPQFYGPLRSSRKLCDPPDTDPYAGACNANARENHHPCVAEVQREEISREVVSCFRTSGHAIVFRLITIAILQNQTR